MARNSLVQVGDFYINPMWVVSIVPEYKFDPKLPEEREIYGSIINCCDSVPLRIPNMKPDYIRALLYGKN